MSGHQTFRSEYIQTVSGLVAPRDSDTALTHEHLLVDVAAPRTRVARLRG